MTDPHASFRTPAQQVSGLGLFASHVCTPDCPTHWQPAPGLRALFTPVEKGIAGSEDAKQHLVDAAPAFVLKALGDALHGLRNQSFSSERVPLIAEQSEAVKGWLAPKLRDKVLGGWWRSRVKLFHLERTGEDEIASRPEARGR